MCPNLFQYNVQCIINIYRKSVLSAINTFQKTSGFLFSGRIKALQMVLQGIKALWGTPNGAYFKKRTRTRTWTFRKSGPRTFIKNGGLHQNSLYGLRSHLRRISGCWFQTWQYFFKILAFPFQDSDIFIISRNFRIRQIRRCWFQIW